MKSPEQFQNKYNREREKEGERRTFLWIIWSVSLEACLGVFAALLIKLARGDMECLIAFAKGKMSSKMRCKSANKIADVKTLFCFTDRQQ